MYLFGKNIKAGVFGTNVNLSNLTNDGQLQGVQHDYRRVFATLLQDWLGASPFIMEQTMFDGYVKLPAIDPAAVVDPDCYWGAVSATQDAYQVERRLTIFPNPASVSAEVSYRSETAFEARLTLHSLGGSLVSATTVQVLPGNNLFYLDVISIPAAIYFVRLEQKSSGAAEVVKLNVVR
jgi:hypothetical protein